MNTLVNKIIIFDDNCPLCNWYTGHFVKHSYLPADGRKAYTRLHEVEMQAIDAERYRTEIALIDTAGGETLYGTDALGLIIGSRFPFLKPLLGNNLFQRAIKKLYRFISFNRKIIAPEKINPGRRDCSPPFSLKYRLWLIGILSALSVAMTLACGSAFASAAGIPASQGAWQLLLEAGTGWCLQFLLAAIIMKREGFNYIAGLHVIMVKGLLLLMPFALLAYITGSQSVAPLLAGSALSFGYMLYAHIRRADIAGISQMYTISWVMNLCATAAFWFFYFN